MEPTVAHMGNQIASSAKFLKLEDGISLVGSPLSCKRTEQSTCSDVAPFKEAFGRLAREHSSQRAGNTHPHHLRGAWNSRSRVLAPP